MYYGVDIHHLLREAKAEANISKPIPTALPTPPAEPQSTKLSLLWTEKYRARKFTDLIGDERTHRAVMHWLKRWDQIVFPGSYRPKPQARTPAGFDVEDRAHRKILMLTGPPGLGKTTLAHVCAKQAGFEVQEINASDERSRDVVRGRIRDMVGTENVKGVDTKTVCGKVRKAGKPVCVIVDEVDGAVSGSGGSGEGGFVKALIDLVILDQKNSTTLGTLSQAPTKRRERGDKFRMLRPLILICNDVYHPSLRPLRQSSMAEVVHVRKPQVQTIASRLHSIFGQEGVPADTDGVRRLCEATWGVSNRKEDRSAAGAGEGDMRGIMVVAEWVAGKLRSMRDATGDIRLTRRWIEDHVLSDLAHGGGGARGVGRGGPKDIVNRIFAEGAGFPKASIVPTPSHATSAGIGTVKGVTETLKKTATERLRQLLDTNGDSDRIMTDVWVSYPTQSFQDDTLLSKPDSAYEWLHFHDCLSSAVHTSNEWELAPYLSTPVLAFHHLFASQTRSWAPAKDSNKEDSTEEPHPLFSLSAPWAASEARKSHEAILQSFQASLTLPLTRLFPAPSEVATDLLPYLLRMLNPNINPTVIGGSGSDRGTASVRKSSEQALVSRAVSAMAAAGVHFDRIRVSPDATTQAGGTKLVYRMEPALDSLGEFETGGKGFGEAAGAKTRFAVRQLLEQELKKDEMKRAEAARMARFRVGINANGDPDTLPNAREHKGGVDDPAKRVRVARDFFGRPMSSSNPDAGMKENGQARATAADQRKGHARYWITHHEGFSNAVRKPVSLADLMRDL